MPTESPLSIEAQLEKEESSLMWYYFIRVPNSVAEKLITSASRRVVVGINKNQEVFRGALMHDGKGGYYITLNKERRNRLGLRSGELVQLSLKSDTSEYGVEVSEELLEVLDQDSDGNKWFHSLTPGMQRTLIHWVDNVKSSEIKIRRALVLMNHLKEQEGQPEFKRLNAEIKEANQLANRK